MKKKFLLFFRMDRKKTKDWPLFNQKSKEDITSTKKERKKERKKEKKNEWMEQKVNTSISLTNNTTKMLEREPVEKLKATTMKTRTLNDL